MPDQIQRVRQDDIQIAFLQIQRGRPRVGQELRDDGIEPGRLPNRNIHETCVGLILREVFPQHLHRAG